MDRYKFCLFLPALNFGGAERVMLNLGAGLSDAGMTVHMCVARAQGELVNHVPDSIRLIDFATNRPLTAVPALARYLRQERPSAVIASMTHTGFAALWARALSHTTIPVVIRQENTWSKMREHMQGRHRWINPVVARWVLPKADHIIAVSRGVADDLLRSLRVDPAIVSVIANPVIDDAFRNRVRESPPHDWLIESATPVVVAAGRFVHAKGFDILVDAFAMLREQTTARLIIFGDGPDRASLEARINAHGLKDRILLPGYTDKLTSAMAHASVFAMSSRWEGLSLVLVEALAAGAMIVATDCPNGPREILDGGRFGALVPPENPQALARALLEALQQPQKPQQNLAEWLRPYTVNQSTQAHLQLLTSLLRARSSPRTEAQDFRSLSS